MASVDSTAGAVPDRIGSELELDELLTRPGPGLVEAIRGWMSPLVVLGAGGKMGPGLAVLAKRAALAAGHELEVVAVSRFGDPATREWLEARGVRTLACDLLDRRAIERLPDSRNVAYLVGLKFGTGRNPSLTWAMNTLVPGNVCERYGDGRTRIVALSTGNVYPLAEVSRGGSVETDPLTPVGEYANAAVGRERVFEFEAVRRNIPLVLLRLYYAIDLRYGVLVDIAGKVAASEPIRLGNGHVTCIWQGDANDLILRSIALTSVPPAAYNLCRPEIIPVRAVATRLGELLGKAPRFEGEETGTAIVGNSARLCQALGDPPTSVETMLRRVAHWVSVGGKNLGRPTHFEIRDGRY